MLLPVCCWRCAYESEMDKTPTRTFRDGKSQKDAVKRGKWLIRYERRSKCWKVRAGGRITAACVTYFEVPRSFFRNFFCQKGKKNPRLTNAPNPVSTVKCIYHWEQGLTCKNKCSFGLSIWRCGWHAAVTYVISWSIVENLNCKGFECMRHLGSSFDPSHLNQGIQGKIEVVELLIISYYCEIVNERWDSRGGIKTEAERLSQLLSCQHHWYSKWLILGLFWIWSHCVGHHDTDRKLTKGYAIQPSSICVVICCKTSRLSESHGRIDAW